MRTVVICTLLVVTAAGCTRRAVSQQSETPSPPREQPGPPPRYPVVLLSTRVEGDVVLVATRDSGGSTRPTSVRVVRSSHELFGVAARRAVEQWRLPPASDTVEIRLRFVIASPERCAGMTEPVFTYDSRTDQWDVQACPKPLRTIGTPPPVAFNQPTGVGSGMPGIELASS